MSDFKTRMVDEHTQLTERSNKLRDFLWGPIFNTLPDVDKELLIKQLAHMEAYAVTLAERISRT